MNMDHRVNIFVGVLGVVGTITAAIIGANFGKNNITIVLPSGNKTTLSSKQIEDLVSENEDLQKLKAESDNVIKENQNQLLTISELKEENNNLKSQIEELKTENENLQNKLVQYSEINDDSIQGETVEFSQVPDILYDGERFTKYINSEEKSFSVGGKTYYTGFEINTHYEGWKGFVYFNLERKYSKMVFDVGRNFEDKCDATLLVSNSDGLREEYNLAGDIPSQHIEIDLNMANDLTLKLKSDNNYVGFGFFNIYFIP